ncbi:glycerophosphodiester phosphodiesterase [Lactiplantibacillus plantarum]|uniref:glycerophosphodiester phosphodiesterase n=1 Tax=Lactiplantibacillus plantarum TaxID=1590 RepID=UPI0039A07799
MISTITLDTYKQQISSGDAFNLSDSFNGRVGDEQVPLVVQFKERGLAQQFEDGLVPFLSGFVGSFDENDQVTAATGEAVSYVGTSDDIVGLGRVKMNLPGTMFPQEGYFYGFLGLQNAGGKRVTTFNVWFHVYNGNPDMFVNKAPFRTELQKVIDAFNDLLTSSKGTFSTSMNDWKQQVTALLTDLNGDYAKVQTTVNLVQQQLTTLEGQIKLDGLITVNEFDGKFAAANKTVTDTLKTVSGYVDTVKNSSWIYNNIKPLCAHRGAHIDAPENTAMAVAHAGMYGYGLIECDPRLTSDNQVVVMHDDTVDRMTDGTGNVSDFTLDQLKQMTVDAAFSGKNDYNTIRVPTLAEILHEVNQYGMGVNIDGSKLNWQDDNVINTVVGVIKQAGLMGRSFFVISDSAARKRLNALYPEAALTWLDYDNINNYIAEAKTYTNAVISIGYGNLSRDYSAIAASGLPLHVYGVNSASQYDDSIQHGARFVETDSLLPMTVTHA